MPGQRYLFDAIVLAGNVMIFLAPGSEATVVANLARHLTLVVRWWPGFSSTQAASRWRTTTRTRPRQA